MWLYAVLLLTWLAKVGLHPTPVDSVAAFAAHAAIGPVSGWLVVAGGVVFHGALLALAVITWGLHTASGEVVTPAQTRHKISRDAGATSPVPDGD
ncbi:MAG TPA: DUF2270 domain-containing protein [Chloroflexota bacterium]